MDYKVTNFKVKDLITDKDSDHPTQMRLWKIVGYNLRTDIFTIQYLKTGTLSSWSSWNLDDRFKLAVRDEFERQLEDIINEDE